MDIKELQDYRLSDAIKFHTHLNPRIWRRDEHLLPEVREKLLAIAADFKEFLGLDLEVTDITISGSNAAYTYTDHSDIDLHLVADLPKADASEIYRELFDAKKYQYNDQHNFKIGGYDVELYVQNANEDPKSQGIYSVLDNKWLSVPKRRKPDVDDISVKSKYEDLGRRIEAAVKSGDAAQLETLGKKVREFRQAGLDKTGEFGPENLAFKILRSNGTLDQLRAARLAAKDRELSVDETQEKKYVKYGFKDSAAMEDWHPNEEPPGPETKPEMPAGTVMVDVSDTYDWYKLGQDISDLDHADPAMYGQGAPQTIISFGSEPIEHKYIKKLDKLGLKTHDIDPKGKKRDRETEYSVTEAADNIDTQLQNFIKFCSDRLELEQIPHIRIKRDPEWSRRNNSFGRYIPDEDTLIVSVANRHPMDVMRTMAHELTHRKQDEQADMPIGAGDTGSDWENQANAQAGVLMRDFAELHPEYFGKEPISEASGYIPVNKKEAGDPRYSMALTVDIKPGENQRQAAKMGWKTNPAGTPPTAKTNGLVEALTRKLQAVKEGLGFPLVSEQEQELEEVAMSPSALRAFANSEAAAGMKAGFEAELVFTGLGGDEEEGEWEPDYSYDPRAYSLENIEDFFGSGEFAEGLSRRQLNALEEDWMEWYDQTLYDEFDAPVAVREWIQDNDWDEEDLIERALDDEYSEDRVKEILAAMERRVQGTGTAADADLVEEYVGAKQEVERQLDERVELAVEEQNSDYESALDEFRENWDKDESDWLRDRGWRHMSDLSYNFDFAWPHMTMSGGSSEGGFNQEAAQQLADSLSETLGVETTVSTGYHGATRDTSTWIFEPDGSLDADDSDNMPVEIVSPPMPLSKTLEILPEFFEWAEDNGAYANDSTGFHMSVSMPEHEGNMLDYTKLALFLGDEYVLKQFGREANTYARSAISKIRERKGNVNAETVMSAMRKHLDQFASRALAQPSGFGKYTSINPKSKYIEFRSAGGSNYFEDMDKIQNTLMRYARAMDIAMNPKADKPEYAKKLYKMLTDVKTQQVVDPKTGTKRTEVVPGLDNDAIAVFSRFVAGELPKSELKGFIKKIQYGREAERQAAEGKTMVWRVTSGNSSVELVATGEKAAKLKASIEWNIDPNSDRFDSFQAVPLRPAPEATPPTQTPQTDQLNAPAAVDPRGNYVLRQREGAEGRGAVLHRFSAPNNGAAIEAAREWTTAQGIERRTVWLDHISGVPPEVLNASPTNLPSQTDAENRLGLGDQTADANYEIIDNSNQTSVFKLIANTVADAARKYRQWLEIAGLPAGSTDYGLRRLPPRSSSIPEVPLDVAQNFSPIETEPQNFPAARSTGGEFTGQWNIVNSNTGEIVHTFGGAGNVQADANRLAAQWARQARFDDPIEVYPQMR